MTHETLATYMRDETGWYEIPDEPYEPYKFYTIANKGIALIMPGVDIHVYVMPEHRHKGIGTKLLKMVLKEYPGNPWTGFKYNHKF